jgi:hypothetical protein
MVYLLDANVFIEAKNRYYGFDFCPAFRDWIDDRHAAGTVFSTESVGDELVGGGDELATWAQQRLGAFFVSPDPAVVPSLHATSAWANGAGYEPAAVSTFLQAADYYLIAQTHAHGHVVVTHEIPGTSSKRIKIPDACINLGVRTMTPFAMLRAERSLFILGQRA